MHEDPPPQDMAGLTPSRATKNHRPECPAKPAGTTLRTVTDHLQKVTLQGGWRMRQTSRWLAGLVAAGATAFALAGAVPADAATRSHTVYVAPHGAAGNADRSCRTARYRSTRRGTWRSAASASPAPASTPSWFAASSSRVGIPQLPLGQRRCPGGRQRLVLHPGDEQLLPPRTKVAASWSLTTSGPTAHPT